MLTRLNLTNFKGWQTTGSRRLAPITVLFGSNSSGKTSLLQSLLLLKQTAASSDRTRVLHPGDRQSLVDLGTVSDLVFGHATDRTLGIFLEWSLPQALEIGSSRPQFLSFQLEVTFDDGQPEVHLARYHWGDGHATMTRAEDGTYSLDSIPALKRRVGRPTTIPPPLRFYGFPEEVFATYQGAEWLSDLPLALEKQLDRIEYVGPLRQYPERSYLWSGERPRNVGTQGEFAIAALLAARAEKRRRHPLLEPTVAHWLKTMGVIDSFDVAAIGKGRKEHEVRVKVARGSAEVLITDVGFGVSQLLPVLVQCYYAQPGATVIFEQPEIHLHPRVQAVLADVLVDASARGGVQFVVESHSEHFLRRLQRRVAEEKISAAQVALYFCGVEDGHSVMTELQVDEYGSINNWPKDFFGDEMGDLLAMSDAAMQREKRKQ